MIAKINSLDNHKGLIKYSKNTLWMLAQKGIQMVIGLFIGIWVARYLGPEKFGILSYVMSFVAMLAPITKLGLDAIISREIAKKETSFSELLSTGFILKFIGGVVAVVISGVYMLLTEDNNVYFILALLFSSRYLINGFQVIQFYYRAKVQAKYNSLALIGGSISSAIYRALLIISGSALIYFGAAVSLKILITSILLIIFFRKNLYLIKLYNFKFGKAKELLKECWPLVFSGIFAILFINIDKFMIGKLLNEHDVGQYSAASKLSEVWFVVPALISQSVLTAFVNSFKKNKDQYFRRLQSLSTLMFVFSIIIILPLAIFSEKIITLLYGNNYIGGAQVLTIHIFSLLFIFIGNIKKIWATVESHFRFIFISNIVAGSINILLNYILIMEYGVTGAAYATLISFSIMYFFSNIFYKPARKILKIQIKSFLLIDFYNKIRRAS